MMTQLYEQISNQKQLWSDIEKNVSAELEVCAANGADADKHLHLVKNKKQWQYYLSHGGKNQKDTYIPKKQRKLAAAIAQRDYDLKVLTVLAGWQKKLAKAEAILKTIPSEGIAILHQAGMMHEGRRALVKPKQLTDEEFVAAWKSQCFRQKEPPMTGTVLETNLGEKVRSKSEKIIADFLSTNKIPYRYEAELRLSNGKVVHPDFTILRVSDRKEVYLEHFGMMDDKKYITTVVTKINWYAESAVKQHREFFYTCELSNIPLSMYQLYELLPMLR